MEPELVHVNVKLAARADREAAYKRLSIIPGVKDVIQTFPGEADEELARLCSLKIEPRQVKNVIKLLQHDAAIDFVETAAPRRLIGPIRSSRTR